ERSRRASRANKTPPAIEGRNMKRARCRCRAQVAVFQRRNAAKERRRQGEDHHADTTQIHRHDAGRRPSAHHKRTTGAAAARKQAHDRRRPGAFLESKFAGLALGSGCQAAIAGTIHHRARAANDGRSWRRPRSHRAPGLNDRNDYALEAAKRYPNRFGIMGRIPLQDPKSAALLPTWKQQPGMLGVRVTFNTPPTLAWLSDGTADWFWPPAEKAGLAGMFLAVGEVPRFAHIAERHPQLTLIIDHMGLNSSSRTNRITENIPAAIDQAIALAKYPNVSIKLSGALGNSLEPY